MSAQTDTVKGWECPRCGRIWAPAVLSCICSWMSRMPDEPPSAGWTGDPPGTPVTTTWDPSMDPNA